MSLSDQHPYSQFIAGGLRSPTLAWTHVKVGDNANTYLVSVNIVAFSAKLNHPHPTLAVGSTPERSSWRTKFRRSGQSGLCFITDGQS